MESLLKKKKAEERTGAIAGEDEIENSDNDESEEEEKDEVKKLLKPFSADQVFDILCDAAMKDAQLLHNIRKLADKNLPHKKVYIDGLHSTTTEETLYSIFSLYGELEECTVVMDDDLERSEGCAFVTYKHLDGAERALKYPCKKIDSRRTLCRLASDEQEQAQVEAVAMSQKNVRRRKILVSNVPVYMSCLKLVNHFSLYGEIEEGQLGFDSKFGKLKAHVIFTYKNVEGAKKALEEPDKNVYGHYMHCTRVAKKQKQKEDVQNIPLDRSGQAVTHGKGSIMGPDPVEVLQPEWFDDSELDMGLSNLATGASSSQLHAKSLQWDMGFPKLATGASSSQHHQKVVKWELDFPNLPTGAFSSHHHAKALQKAIPLQAYLETQPIAALPGLNTYKHGLLAGIKYDSSSHAAQQGLNFYQTQQLSQAAAPDLPDLNAPDHIYDTQVIKEGKNAYKNQQLSQAAVPDLPDLTVVSHVYDSQATKEENNASENQQLNQSTSNSPLEPIVYQIQELGLQAIHQTWQDQQPACPIQQPNAQAIHQTQQDQLPAYQIQPPTQLMLNEQTGQPPAPGLQKQHNQSQILFPRRSQQ
ncbi:uncharacterized protein LOC131036329 [Cryptomeria japonica]|uniref:uncharacterized protein LOC131036329 n=1 Tax=Cryptomeria japonica TaxID=3369 RepID=UPI0027DA01D7|nr:uncharacterized protein LOC131036329 [Cryptomeria japonica]XP_057824174.2 uncharacterized protein LOC131036329 [Cryptomeria japonica]XP_057824184.2 uncharacterized protein LOC131036329 [Cryptomeria japonica]XP_057824193.2 uncharacterized protein LOC131036329 [Cryptomeria japonica]XP_059069143.1 uncharacterized protein LOC131036329 [Cryptomeria japonica]